MSACKKKKKTKKFYKVYTPKLMIGRHHKTKMINDNNVDYYFCYDSPLTAAKLASFQQLVEKRVIRNKSFDDYV